MSGFWSFREPVVDASSSKDPTIRCLTTTTVLPVGVEYAATVLVSGNNDNNHPLHWRDTSAQSEEEPTLIEMDASVTEDTYTSTVLGKCSFQVSALPVATASSADSSGATGELPETRQPAQVLHEVTGTALEGETEREVAVQQVQRDWWSSHLGIDLMPSAKVWGEGDCAAPCAEELEKDDETYIRELLSSRRLQQQSAGFITKALGADHLPASADERVPQTQRSDNMNKNVRGTSSAQRQQQRARSSRSGPPRLHTAEVVARREGQQQLEEKEGEVAMVGGIVEASSAVKHADSALRVPLTASTTIVPVLSRPSKISATSAAATPAFVLRMEQRAAARKAAWEEREARRHAKEEEDIMERMRQQEQSQHLRRRGTEKLEDRPPFSLFGLGVKSLQPLVTSQPQQGQRLLKTRTPSARRNNGGADVTIKCHFQPAAQQRQQQHQEMCRSVIPLNDPVVGIAGTSTRAAAATAKQGRQMHNVAFVVAAIQGELAYSTGTLATPAAADSSPAEGEGETSQAALFKELHSVAADYAALSSVRGVLSLWLRRFHVRQERRLALEQHMQRQQRSGAAQALWRKECATIWATEREVLCCAEAAHRATVWSEFEKESAVVSKRARRSWVVCYLQTQRQRREMYLLRWYFVCWVAVESETRAEREAKAYRAYLMDCARRTLESLNVDNGGCDAS